MYYAVVGDRLWQLVLDEAPEPEFRAGLGNHIHAFHAQTIAGDAERFALRLLGAQGELVGGLSGVVNWQWLFIDALWVHETLRGQGAGRALMAHAERHAAQAGCHSAWLDSFQAKAFYEAIGYRVFAALPNYPPGQTRWFLSKRLNA